MMYNLTGHAIKKMTVYVKYDVIRRFIKFCLQYHFSLLYEKYFMRRIWLMEQQVTNLAKYTFCSIQEVNVELLTFKQDVDH